MTVCVHANSCLPPSASGLLVVHGDYMGIACPHYAHTLSLISRQAQKIFSARGGYSPPSCACFAHTIGRILRQSLKNYGGRVETVRHYMTRLFIQLTKISREQLSNAAAPAVVIVP